MPRRKILKWMIATIVITGVAIIYFLYEPQQHGFYLFCPLHRYTGFKCPLCGLQQMIHHLLHGQISLAFGDNPFLFILMPYIICWLYLDIFNKKEKHRKLFTVLYGDRILLILFIIAAIFGVGRNIY